MLHTWNARSARVRARIKCTDILTVHQRPCGGGANNILSPPSRARWSTMMDQMTFAHSFCVDCATGLERIHGMGMFCGVATHARSLISALKMQALKTTRRHARDAWDHKGASQTQTTISRGTCTTRGQTHCCCSISMTAVPRRLATGNFGNC